MPDVSVEELKLSLDEARFKVQKPLMKRVNIYLVKIIDSSLTASQALKEISENPWIQHAQFDHYITQRQNFPDDSDFGSQWGMHNTGQSSGLEDADIDAPEAWDLSTGGVNVLGDDIVVAIVDGGCLLTHPDLDDNIWVNTDEISGNNIDDDNDGYVDDVNGGLLRTDLVRAARADEVTDVKRLGVYVKRPIAECRAKTGKNPVGIRWVDTNKGDDALPDYRSRLVGCELKARTKGQH